MTVAKWIESFGESVCVSKLRNPQAVALASFLNNYANNIASFVEARRQCEEELIIIHIHTGSPQTPFYPILQTEKVGILFGGKDVGPRVVVLREDFPDTEHQLWVPKGHPPCICIDDRPWEEARITWIASDLINRILLWFHRASTGKLHDMGQPLDPNLLRSFFSFVVADSILNSGSSENLIAERKQSTVFRIRRLLENLDIDNTASPICIKVYQVPPERMRRMRYIPRNLGELKEMLADRDINLYDDLSTLFRKWLFEGELIAWKLKVQLAIIIRMPIVSPSNEQEQGDDLRAFVIMKPAGEIAVGLGVASEEEELSEVGYVSILDQPVIDNQVVDPIVVESAEIHLEFERDLATKLAGRSTSDTRKAVLLGAGAIGSHIANCLAREGRFCWTIIDNDLVFPHNLARHIAHNNYVCQYKAEVLANYINNTLVNEATQAKFVNQKLLENNSENAVTKALNEANLIIDATASVLAAHVLSDHESQARRFSAFLNPSGNSAILLAEPASRTLNLRDLEAQYLAAVLSTKRLAEHFKSPETIAYTGACRAITNRIPESRVSILSGLVSIAMNRAVDRPDAVISIWSLAPNGKVTLNSVAPKSISRYHAHDWTITIDSGLKKRIHAMRKAHLPNETGGILFGCVDIPKKLIHLIDASPAPPDSKEKKNSFKRGKEGVQELIETIAQKTMGQVRYVGEWHSHPLNVSGQPSFVDLHQIDWLSTVTDIDSMPALMLIASDQEITLVFANRQAKPLVLEQ